jgi:hypothetical protein
MPFRKLTESECHEVVKDQEREAIRRIAGNRSTEELAEAERARLLRELEAARRRDC